MLTPLELEIQTMRPKDVSHSIYSMTQILLERQIFQVLQITNSKWSLSIYPILHFHQDKCHEFFAFDFLMFEFIREKRERKKER